MASTPTTPPPTTPPQPTLADDDALAAAPRLLTFAVGGVTYGCPLDAVREVLPSGPTARLPGAPPHVLGLLNVRGRPLTVLDLARRLDPAAGAASGPVLVVEADGRAAGCRVDAVRRTIVAQPLEPLPAGDGSGALGDAAGNAEVGRIVLGIGEVEGAPLVVLDLARFVMDTLVDPGER